MFKQNNCYQKNPSIVCTELDDGGILLNLDTKYYYTLNQTGLRIWQILDELKSPSDIVRNLTIEYEVDENMAMQSVARIMKDMERENLIIPFT